MQMLCVTQKKTGMIKKVEDSEPVLEKINQKAFTRRVDAFFV
jgi:hypothetical protein